MLEIKMTERNGPSVLPDVLEKAARAAAEASVTDWWATMMPAHFENAAASRYGYQPRKKGYAIAKARAKRHQRPLVWSGRSEAAAKARISVTTKVVKRREEVESRGTLSLPRYFYQYRKDHNAPDKAAELTSVDDADQKGLTAFYQNVMTRELGRGVEGVGGTTQTTSI